jgi:hypothetical protein
LCLSPYLAHLEQHTTYSLTDMFRHAPAGTEWSSITGL